MNNAGQPMMTTMAEKTTTTTLPNGNTVITIRLTTKNRHLRR
jgi:predicted Zn-dependent peptidase